jgi:hypothetical protein
MSSDDAAPATGVAPSYWSVLARLMKAAPLRTIAQVLPLGMAMSWLIGHFPSVANPSISLIEAALIALASAAAIALSIAIMAVPANPIGAVLLAETGRPPLGLRALLIAAWKGTLVQLVTVTVFLFGWAYSAGHVARYAVQDLGVSYDVAETSMLSSIWLVGGIGLIKLLVTSALTMVDVQFGGPPTIKRSLVLFYRSPLRAVGATLLAVLASLVCDAVAQTLISVLASDHDLSLIRGAIVIALATWWITVCVFAHYRVAFGPDGAT